MRLAAATPPWARRSRRLVVRRAPAGRRRRPLRRRRARRAPRRRRRTRRCRSGPRRRRAFRRRPLPRRPCRSSRPPRRARRRPPAGRGRAAAARSPAGCGPGRSSPVSDCARWSAAPTSVTVVRPRDHDDVRLRDLARRLEQVLDPFAGRDPADVEDRAARSSGMPSCARRAPFERRGGAARGSRCRERAPSPDRLRTRSTSSRLALGCDDDRSSAASHTAIERCVERALEHDLAQPRLEHAERLEDVRHAREPAPRGGAVVTGSRKPNTCTTSGAVEPRERERKRRRDPHPAVAQRRREVVDAWPRRRRRSTSAPLGAGRGRRSSSSARPRCDRAPRAAGRAPAATTGPPKAREGAQTRRREENA